MKFQNFQKSEARSRVQKRMGTENILEANYDGDNNSQRTTKELGRQAILLTRGGVPKDLVCSRYAQEKDGRMTPTLLPTFDQTRCMHPLSVECYAVRAFSIASDFDPKVMPKEQNQITNRKV